MTVRRRVALLIISVSLLLLGGCDALGLVATPTPLPPPERSVALEPVAEGLTAPVTLVHPPDESGRRFIVDQAGTIRILSSEGELLEAPFLDVRERMVEIDESYDERGLLGLDFHPDYAANGRFFVYYSAPLAEDAPDDWDHTSHISEFSVSADDPNRADPDTERVLLAVNEPQFSHNGGDITFGPDGYLYIPLGDGGGVNDIGTGHPPEGNGQDLTTLLGSILRIDVDGGDPYDIPEDNPFVGQEGRDEIYAYGFRNPFRISFDAEGDQALYTGDVGQNLWEEADIVQKGQNYGWHIREGTHCFNPESADDPPADCPEEGADGSPLIAPILEYWNMNAGGEIGLAIIGGYVYRGDALPELQGGYLFGDWSRSHEEGDGSLFFAARPSNGGARWSFEELGVANGEEGRVGAFVLGVGEDGERELYVLTSEQAGPSGNTGKVYKIVPAER